MYQAAQSFASSQLPKHLKELFPHGPPVSAAVGDVAKSFVKLRDRRESADYDPDVVFMHAEAIGLVEEVRQAFAAWKAALADPAQGPACELFLLALLFGERLKR